MAAGRARVQAPTQGSGAPLPAPRPPAPPKPNHPTPNPTPPPTHLVQAARERQVAAVDHVRHVGALLASHLRGG